MITRIAQLLMFCTLALTMAKGDKNMKKVFEETRMEIIEFSTDDVIVTSGSGSEEGTGTGSGNGLD